MSQKESSQQQLVTELQSHGLRLTSADQRHVSRRGGAGPSDHQAITVNDTTIMVPIYSESTWTSPFSMETTEQGDRIIYNKNDNLIPLKEVTFTQEPHFYRLKTKDGIPYSQLATLHSKDVLATTILQTCIRYESRKKACKFCSIGQSLRAGRTIAHKTPEQLAQVAKAAVELDRVTHMVLTTGTPASSDRGAHVLCESAKAIKATVNLPIQGQCEPPTDIVWYQRMKDAGIDSLGMHLEVISPQLREDIMPGKAEITVDQYMSAFVDAVKVFGRGQVSTYILAGLGDSAETLIKTGKELIDIGVYPFVVPFVPIRGTPLEDHTPPTAEFMTSVLKPLGQELSAAGILATDIKAGCGKCGACSTLSSYENSSN